jgi:AAA+ ATPase superfamily predicted ATPase
MSERNTQKMRPFIGREKELEKLNQLLRKRTSSLVVITGRRRIGKSRLVNEFGKEFTFYNFVGLSPNDKTTAQSQRDEFSRQMHEQFGIPIGVAANNWGDLFTLLSTQVKQGRLIVLFDEISWMGSKDPDFLGKLKNAWDNQFSHNPELILVLCGSVSTWIEKNIINSTGFYGRISLNLTINELPLSNCNEFWNGLGSTISAHEKFKLLSITGGVPRYLEEIIPELTAEENIKNLCFEKDGLLFKEFDQIFSNVFLRKSDIYQRIVDCLIKGKASYDYICECLDIDSSGYVSDYLDELIKAGYIRREYTWHLSSGQQSHLSHYAISDNYLQFYLNFIAPYKQRILTGAFEDRSISSLPGWESIMGLQFENLVLNNRPTLKKLLGIRLDEVIYDNPYFQRKTKRQEKCQIDYLIQTHFNTLYICEIKFSKNLISSSVISQVQQKIDKLKLASRFSCRPVLIHVNGVSDDILDSRYFAEIVDFSQLLQ